MPGIRVVPGRSIDLRAGRRGDVRPHRLDLLAADEDGPAVMRPRIDPVEHAGGMKEDGAFLRSDGRGNKEQEQGERANASEIPRDESS